MERRHRGTHRRSASWEADKGRRSVAEPGRGQCRTTKGTNRAEPRRNGRAARVCGVRPDGNDRPIAGLRSVPILHARRVFRQRLSVQTCNQPRAQLSAAEASVLLLSTLVALGAYWASLRCHVETGRPFDLSILDQSAGSVIRPKSFSLLLSGCYLRGRGCQGGKRARCNFFVAGASSACRPFQNGCEARRKISVYKMDAIRLIQWKRFQRKKPIPRRAFRMMQARCRGSAWVCSVTAPACIGHRKGSAAFRSSSE